MNFDNQKIWMDDNGRIKFVTKATPRPKLRSVVFTLQDLDHGKTFTANIDVDGPRAQINAARDGYAISTFNPEGEEGKKSWRKVFPKWELLCHLLPSERWHEIEGIPESHLEFARELNRDS